MERPFPAYKGNEPYIFVSYAHNDDDTVYSEIQWLKDQGFNIWYDEGISPGSEWHNELADRIQDSSLFVFFITPQSVVSENCQREVHYAIDHGKQLLAVHLEETELPPGIDLSLSSIQAIMRHEMPELDYRIKLLKGANDHLQRGISAPTTKSISISGYSGRRLVGVTFTAALLVGIVTWNFKPSDHQQIPSAREDASGQRVTRFTHYLAPMERISRVNVFFRSTIVLSPDGMLLLYVASRGDGNSQLYLRRRNEFEGRPISGTENAHSPFFSPDGEWVAFFTPTELKRVSLSSGSVVTLTDVIPASTGGSWNSDGNILYTHSPQFGLVSIPASGGIQQELTKSEGWLGHHFPHPLPDGKGLLYTIMRSEAWGHTGIAVLSFETGQWHMLLEEGTHPHYLSSGHLVYALAGTLQAVPFNLDRLEIDGTPVQLLDGVTTGFGADFSVSGDGTLAYVPGDWGWPDRELVWVDRDGEIIDETCQSSNFAWPRISPDGQRVAVTINSRRQGNADIWICELAQNNTLTRLTRTPSWAFNPVWTRDGKRVTYSATGQSTPDLIETAADGTGAGEWLLRRENVGIWPGSWSPDGSTLLFIEENPDTSVDIWLLNKASGDAVPWQRTHATESAPRFSPDGRWIAFHSNESGRYEVFVRSFPDVGQKYRISKAGGIEPVWAADGSELFYRNGDKMMAVDIMVLPRFFAAEPKLLFQRKYWGFNSVGMATYDVASNGRFLMITESEGDLTRINVVVNWAEEVTRRIAPPGTP